jgi:hypothetical protein
MRRARTVDGRFTEVRYTINLHPGLGEGRLRRMFENHPGIVEVTIDQRAECFGNKARIIYSEAETNTILLGEIGSLGVLTACARISKTTPGPPSGVFFDVVNGNELTNKRTVHAVFDDGWFATALPSPTHYRIDRTADARTLDNEPILDAAIAHLYGDSYDRVVVDELDDIKGWEDAESSTGLVDGSEGVIDLETLDEF